MKQKVLRVYEGKTFIPINTTFHQNEKVFEKVASRHEAGLAL